MLVYTKNKMHAWRRRSFITVRACDLEAVTDGQTSRTTTLGWFHETNKIHYTINVLTSIKLSHIILPIIADMVSLLVNYSQTLSDT